MTKLKKHVMLFAVQSNGEKIELGSFDNEYPNEDELHEFVLSWMGEDFEYEYIATEIQYHKEW